MPRQVFADLVLQLYNRQLSIFDIRVILQDRIKGLDNWGFICPRAHLDCIEEDFVLEELDYTAMLTEPDSVQATTIYQQYDAVMVAKKVHIHVD
jgi:hypothetical protein